MLMMGKALDAIDTIVSATGLDPSESIGNYTDDLHRIQGMLAFVEHRMRDLQSLFRSSKQRRRRLVVRDVLDKVRKIYQSSLAKLSIEVEILNTGSPLIALGTDAVLLQLFINLFDNALYWLQEVPAARRKIRVSLDGDAGCLYFSDSGPGVRRDDRPYVFDAFYSGKGQEGRGLGLYIARQLLQRLGYEIDLVPSNKKTLKGATFEVCFLAKDE